MTNKNKANVLTVSAIALFAVVSETGSHTGLNYKISLVSLVISLVCFVVVHSIKEE